MNDLVEKTGKSIVEEYRKIWPGSWPAKAEADRLSRAAIETVLAALKERAEGIMFEQSTKMFLAQAEKEILGDD